MNQSERIGELATAMAKVQGALGGAKKDNTNPYYKSKYADLASVWDACRALLAANAVAVFQTFSTDNGNPVIITTLAHSSGEWISGALTMNGGKKDPQGIGSMITYGRRYSLAAMVGVAPEDDDGESLMDREPDSPKDAKKKAGEILDTVEKYSRLIGAANTKGELSSLAERLGDEAQQVKDSLREAYKARDAHIRGIR